MAAADMAAPELARRLRAGVALRGSVDVLLGDVALRIESNHEGLLRQLEDYFRYFASDGRPPALVVTALEMQPPALELEWTDWPREAGKRGRKEEYADVAGGRVVRKVRTRMQFLMSERDAIAFGPCASNANQVINFVNALYMTRLLNEGWVLCHAAAVVRGSVGLAVAGLAGGGKSTLALHLLAAGCDFASNDRVLVRRDERGVRLCGVPKLPRVNPGTILGNPALAGILSAERRAELARLEPGRLWELEEKYDVDVGRVFPSRRFLLEASLGAFLVLAWHRDSPERTAIAPVLLRERRDLLAAIMKSPGPFYGHADGRPPRPPAEFDEEAYLRQLDGVAVFEARGRVDFSLATSWVRRQLDGDAR